MAAITTFQSPGRFLCMAGTIRRPADRGRFVSANGQSFVRARLPTDPAGLTTLTLTNIAVGSRYRIERQGDGSLATPAANAEGVAASSTVVISLDYYATGSANNDLRIRVRKASAAPKYQPLETLTTVFVGGASVFIAQVPDTIA